MAVRRPQQREIVLSNHLGIGMVRAESLLPYNQGPLLERLGRGIAALVVVEQRQVVEAHGDIGVVGTQGLLA